MTKKFNIGETVYFVDSFGIDTGKIKSVQKTKDTNGCVVFYTIDTKLGEIKCIDQDIFETFGKATMAKVNRSKQKRKNYESKITNIPELLSFMISQMHCEEYTDYEAIEASKNKIKELLGIEI